MWVLNLTSSGNHRARRELNEAMRSSPFAAAGKRQLGAIARSATVARRGQSTRSPLNAARATLKSPYR